MSARAAQLDQLILLADVAAERMLARVRSLLPDEAAASWDLERDIFNLEDPRVRAEQEKKEERDARTEPVGDRPSMWPWRALFRRNWP